MELRNCGGHTGEARDGGQGQEVWHSSGGQRKEAVGLCLGAGQLREELVAGDPHGHLELQALPRELTDAAAQGNAWLQR